MLLFVLVFIVFLMMGYNIMEIDGKIYLILLLTLSVSSLSYSSSFLLKIMTRVSNNFSTFEEPYYT